MEIKQIVASIILGSGWFIGLWIGYNIPFWEGFFVALSVASLLSIILYFLLENEN